MNKIYEVEIEMNFHPSFDTDATRELIKGLDIKLKHLGNNQFSYTFTGTKEQIDYILAQIHESVEEE